MESLFGPKKKIRCHVQPSIGNFALDTIPPKDVHWDHCREQFSAKFNESIDGFYFSHPKGKSIDIAVFINKFEKLVEAQKFSTFSRTEKQTIMWIEPSSFWRDCPIKRSFFTIVLRCALNYDLEKDNFDDVFFGDYKENSYIKETKSAVLRFMFGFTKFNGSVSKISLTAPVIKHGWREEFIKLDDSTIRRRLIKPEGTKNEKSIVGIESLWL